MKVTSTWGKSIAPFLLGSLLAAGPALGQAEYGDGDAQNAQRLIKKRCAKCHGNDGRGVSDEYSSLAGQSAEYLLKQIFNFKTGQRQSQKMQKVADDLSAHEAFIVSEYFARLRPGSTPSADEAAKMAGRKLYFEGNPGTGVYNCVSCHGVYATGGGLMPRLAGQNRIYLQTQIRKLVDRSRTNDRAMHYINAPLSASEIESLATYLSAEE